MRWKIKSFLEHQAAGGLVLIAAALAALVLKNSPLSGAYDTLLELPVAVQVGALRIAKPLLLWVNDGLMVVFFFLVGLEIKRELLEGQLSNPSQAVLPVVAAVGGMTVPAAIYWLANAGDATALRGWAIPVATDIAFALGVLMLLGRRVPASLKVFLTAVAIIDDLGAIVIIALFYTGNLSLGMIGLAALGVATLVALNMAGVVRLGAYLLVGVALWLCVLKSGVHATLAGVICALAVPLRARDAHGHSPLHVLERDLQPWVAFGVLPVFAFFNAGVPVSGVTFATFGEGVPLGIAAGLLLGKTLGISAVCGLMVRLGWAALPPGANWRQLFGVAVLAGIGFTMSLFIGALAFEGEDKQYLTLVRLGVLTGSLVSALAGYAVLRLSAARG